LPVWGSYSGVIRRWLAGGREQVDKTRAIARMLAAVLGRSTKKLEGDA
jgi:hypothetical protein